MTKKNRVADVLLEAARSLPGDSARTDAELLMAQALGQPRSWLYAHSDDELGEDQARGFRALLERRRHGEPVAQILGVREFWSLPLVVTADTLIPRPETELLVELALQRIPGGSSRRVLDLGTGTGAIALAIAKERPLAEVTAIDADPRTLRVAQKNAARLGLAQVEFLLGNWFSAVRDERYDVIVSNPPYIADDDPHLAQGDLRFEPRSALASGPDGLAALREIAGEAPHHLRAGGSVLLEHGFDQGGAVRALLATSGFAAVTTHVDMEGRDRVTSGNYPS
jgi:release factor glutamine methyltransferase